MFKAFIVDDDKFVAEATYMMFPWDELNVDKIEKIYDPQGLTEKILLEKPDIVFIDIEMGSVSGLDIIAECKEQNSNALFVIITGHDNFNYAHIAVNLGAIYYLLKPIDRADVESVTKKLKKILNPEEFLPPEAFLDELWGKILDYIEKNYGKKLQAQDICSELYISTTTFFKVFKRNSGETFVEYLTRFRLEKAKIFLKTTTRSIPDISESVGIKDPYYFNKVFKKYTGVTAQQYRNRRGE